MGINSKAGPLALGVNELAAIDALPRIEVNPV
jgi:hypothetical protein